MSTVCPSILPRIQALLEHANQIIQSTFLLESVPLVQATKPVW